MYKQRLSLTLIMLTLFCFLSESLYAQVFIKNWGLADYHGWPILNDSSTAAGEVSIGGATKDGWASVRGSFGQTIEASFDSAVIVSGRLEFIGDGLGLTGNAGLRYALTWQDDEGVLENQYTDSAAWSVIGNHYGYEFTPYSGYQFSYPGTVWTIIDSNWASTWSNNGSAISYVYQVPYPAEIVEGVYDWAISVQPLADGTNEVRWYLRHTDKASYWFAGIAIDTAQVTTKFNGICFGVGPDVPETLTRFNLTKVQVDRGDPIEIPEAPFQKFYITQWGLAEYHGWPIMNDSTTAPGYASIGGDTRDGMASLRGSFGQDIAISKDTAIIVSGKIEFVGGSGGDDYIPIRYALTDQNNEGELLYAGTDSAQWSENGGHYGYSIHPRTGKSTMSNGIGGEGTVWTIINGNWCSTYANNGWPVAAINQVPRNAELVAGVYDFAISVHVVDDTTNEIRWFMVEENENYWFSGVVQDTAMTTRFNGIEFGINGDKYNRFNVIGMSVDIGDPLPYNPGYPSYFYIYSWGIIGDNFSGWTTTPGEYDGNFSISGGTPNRSVVALRGDFGQYLSPSSESALKIKGKLILEGGGFEASNSLKFGLFNNHDPGLHIIKPPDSMRWTGSEDKHYGYLFIPSSGANKPAFWGIKGETGNWGAIVDNVWSEPQADNNYAMGGAVQYPENALAGEGTYEFQISFSLSDSGSREIRFKLIKEDESYGFAGLAITKNKSYDTDSFNSISFALDSGNTAIALHLRDVQIDMGEHISLPEWVTSIKQTENSIPSKFSLSQNYPNPFNPITHIKYSIPQKKFISLKIYNILGQEVAVIFEGIRHPGYYNVTFNAKELASGVYVYRLESNNFVQVRKLLLLK